MPERDAPSELDSLGSEFFRTVHTADPFNATQLGVTGFDGLVPDPSRDGSTRVARHLADIESRLGGVDVGQLDDAGRVDHAVLGHLASAARSDYEHSLWEANISAGGYASPQAALFMSVPTALVRDDDSARIYLERLGRLGGFLDAVSRRCEQARADGRIPTAVGVRQAIDQLDGHLAKDIAADTLVSVPLPDRLDAVAFRAEAARIVGDIVRPAAARLAGYLRSELLPVARPDERVGIMFVPGGTDGYRAAVKRHTTTDLTPDQIHELGLDILGALDAEWAELGGRVLGTTDRPSILGRLRNDQALRFASSAEIVQVVTAALRRAEAALGDWFPPLEIGDCVIEEIDPVEAGHAPLAYYRPPAGGSGGSSPRDGAAGGLRPGAHCVLTASPADRFSYEYEALAFHESTPGHHLQIASAQTLTGLPAYRRFLDAEVCGYVEGWGLYCERLADEMGLYTSDVARLGMLSFDALRACRLVVDTGMHHHGWSRSRAVEFMREHTATTQANVENEIDRYIGWPGQALAYMVGRREIQRLRSMAERELGSGFDIKTFHGVVLGNGAVPLGVLGQLVDRWISQTLETP